MTLRALIEELCVEVEGAPKDVAIDPPELAKRLRLLLVHPDEGSGEPSAETAEPADPAETPADEPSGSPNLAHPVNARAVANISKAAAIEAMMQAAVESRAARTHALHTERILLAVISAQGRVKLTNTELEAAGKRMLRVRSIPDGLGGGHLLVESLAGGEG